MSYKTSFAFGFAYFLVLTTTSAQQACLAPNGNRGYCVPLSDCDYIQNLWNYYGNALPEPTRAYIVQSKCMGNTANLHFCCETYLPPSRPNPPPTKAPTRNPSIPSPTRKAIPPFVVPADYESRLNKAGVSILEAQQCGVVNRNRISGGEDAELNEFPWMAVLHYNTKTNPFKCGGSLVSNRYVLTAAHCISKNADDLDYVRLGEHNLNSTYDCIGLGRRTKCSPPVKDYGIAQKIIHPSYDAAAFTYDIGLIKLSEDVDLSSKYIKPICLPITRQSANFEEEIPFVVAGWGYDESGYTSAVLQKANVPYRQLDVCQNAFQQIAFSNVHLCAGGERNTDSCRGDSGGPLFKDVPYTLNENNIQRRRYVQFGIVSFGRIQCGGETVLPGVYANVVYFMPWITNIVGN